MIKQEKVKSTDDILLECERWWIFALLICAGGFYGGYTFSCRGGIFCNAQTANLVLFGMAVGNAEWKTALYYVVPMVSYLAGTVFSEHFPKIINRHLPIRWDTAFVAAEMVIIAIVGFIPESAPVQICHILINFMCSMQYNTFRSAENIPTSTVFCTAHVRSMGVYFSKWLRHKENKAYLKRFFYHTGMISAFVLGAFLGTVSSNIFGIRAILFSNILLFAVFVDLLYADLTKEKNLRHKVPKGH